MADVRRVGRHTHETSALSYGHLGTASYDEKSHKWTFLRKNQKQGTANEDEEPITRQDWPYLQLVDERILSHRARASVEIVLIGQYAASGGGLRNLSLKNIPDSAFVFTDLPSSAYILESQDEVLTPNRPHASTLALGYARPPYEVGMHNDGPATAVVALPARPHRGTLWLLGFEGSRIKTRQGAGQHESCIVPCVTKKVFGCWSDSADEILHVSSANPPNSTQFLVVKSSGTTILRPTLAEAARDKPLQSRYTGSVVAAELSLDSCPIVTIPSSRTGHNLHAHAALCPTDQNLIAIVDTSGQWSVWNLTGRAARSPRVTYQACLQGSNSLVNNEQPSLLKTTTPRRDGWHRICWLPGPGRVMGRVLVCNRRTATAFDYKGEVVGQVDMRLGPLSNGNVILDIQNSNLAHDNDYRSEHLFVLTTSRVMVFSSDEGGQTEKSSAEPLKLMCSWSHGRDRADFGLRMSILHLLRGKFTPLWQIVAYVNSQNHWCWFTLRAVTSPSYTALGISV